MVIAVNGGVYSIEHGTGVSETTLRAMRERGTALVPTIWALDSILESGNPNHIPPNLLEKASQVTRLNDAGMQRAIAANAKIVYGTDAGVVPHRENYKDFALLRSLVMTPLGLLRSATSYAADMIGSGDRGRLAPGSQTSRSLRRPRYSILLDGKKIDRAALKPPSNNRWAP